MINRKLIIFSFSFIYLVCSVISTVHLVDYYNMSNPDWMSISLSVVIVLGSIGTLVAALIGSRLASTVYLLFIVLTLVEILGNTYYSYISLDSIKLSKFTELIGLNNLNEIIQKRIVAILQGGTLPVIGLAFIKALIDYVRSESNDPLTSQLDYQKDLINKLETNIQYQKEEFSDILSKRDASYKLEKDDYEDMVKTLKAKIDYMSMDDDLYQEKLAVLNRDHATELDDKLKIIADKDTKITELKSKLYKLKPKKLIESQPNTDEDDNLGSKYIANKSKSTGTVNI